MISVEKLQKVRTVLYHANCPDGLAAAMICKMALEDHVEFKSLQYDTEFMNNLEPKEGQLFVDITPPKDRWKEWIPFEPIVLDHHATARAVTEGLGGVYGLNETHSGAKLAYEEVYIPLLVSSHRPVKMMKETTWGGICEFANLVMIRDTWKDKDPNWKIACALGRGLIFGNSKNFLQKIEGSSEINLQSTFELGFMLLEEAEHKSKLIARGAWTSEILVGETTVKVGAFNCTENLISDAAHIVIDSGCDVAIGFFHKYEDVKVQTVYSIRTNESVSAREIAQYYGGGGHDRAAGFRLIAGESPVIDSISHLVHQALSK